MRDLGQLCPGPVPARTWFVKSLRWGPLTSWLCPLFLPREDLHPPQQRPGPHQVPHLPGDPGRQALPGVCGHRGGAFPAAGGETRPVRGDPTDLPVSQDTLASPPPPVGALPGPRVPLRQVPTISLCTRCQDPCPPEPPGGSPGCRPFLASPPLAKPRGPQGRQLPRQPQPAAGRLSLRT